MKAAYTLSDNAVSGVLRITGSAGYVHGEDLSTRTPWRNLRLDFAISNLLDRQYASALGGTWQSALYPPGYAGATFRPLPAAGRSFDTGFSVKF